MLFLKREFLHLFELDEAQVIRNLERKDVHTFLIETSVDARNVVGIVSDHVPEFVHDTRPVDRVVGNVIDEAAAHVHRNVFLVCDEVFGFVKLRVKLGECCGQECEVGVMHLCVPDVCFAHTRTVHIAQAEALTSVGGRNAIDEEVFCHSTRSEYSFHLVLPP